MSMVTAERTYKIYKITEEASGKVYIGAIGRDISTVTEIYRDLRLSDEPGPRAIAGALNAAHFHVSPKRGGAHPGVFSTEFLEVGVARTALQDRLNIWIKHYHSDQPAKGYNVA